MTTTRTVVTLSRPGAYLINHYYEGPNGGRVGHRTDGPAIIGFYPHDTDDHLITVWYDHTARHRLDGPVT